MSLAHVFPLADKISHSLTKQTDCFCEPSIIDLGNDWNGQPARVFVHQILKEGIENVKEKIDSK